MTACGPLSMTPPPAVLIPQVLSHSAIRVTHVGKQTGLVSASAYVKAVAGGFRPTRPVGLDDRLWRLIEVGCG